MFIEFSIGWFWADGATIFRTQETKERNRASEASLAHIFSFGVTSVVSLSTIVFVFDFVCVVSKKKRHNRHILIFVLSVSTLPLCESRDSARRGVEGRVCRVQYPFLAC